MAQYVISRPSEDGLSRKRWEFAATLDRCGFALLLDRYGIERRKQPRGRFSRAIPPDRWVSSDERSYNSGLARPKEIPADVLAEAWAAVPRTTYIGWKTEEHKLP